MNETFDPKALPDWIRAAFDQALSASRAPSVLDYRDQAAWPLLVEAAVVRSFLPRDLAPETASSENRAEAEQTVLQFAETTYAPEGVQWTLTPNYRTQVVRAALASGELPKAIESTAQRFKDDVSEALRNYLQRHQLNLESFENLKLTTLEAARAAIASLAGVKELELPSLDRFDREIELRRLLAQFERMIGVPSKAQAKASDRKDLFFGRTEELEKLRAYVGVIPAESFLDSARRAGAWIERRIKGHAPLMVWGIGGAGKTTLISKFMLEHAKAASSRYPFAYLDFDRTTIGARQRLGLLAEMCAQTAAQFDQLSEPMDALQSEIRQLSQDLEVKGDFESNSFVEPYCRRFRKLIDDLLDSLENEWWSRPFLLVFDTFEVVQYTDGEIDGQDDIKGLEEFVQGFSNDDETELWPRLRLIISGRQRITRFLGKVEELSIGALDPQGSADLLAALAADAGRPITDAEAKKLVDAVAKVIKEKNRGVLPLRLRLIGEVFRQSEGGGKQIVESLLDELTQPLGSRGTAAKLLIDGILVTRILNHVADKRVKALADPGLVVRRITPEVIKEVMTRGTTKPDLTKPGSPDPIAEPDTEVVDPWIVDDAEAESIFKAFRREVSLVERDGDALRHRADVRQQMLPLILARRPNRFRSLNRLAFDHFRRLAVNDEEDLASAAEAIYHGLWLEEPLDLIDSFWRNSQKFRPRLDPNEFKVGSHANIYIRARTRKPLKPGEVSKLPKGVALDWVDARSKTLLENRRVEESIEAIRNAAGPQYEGLDNRVESAAVLTRLLYRAGLWDESADLALRHLKDVTTADLEVVAGDEKAEGRVGALVSLIRTLATIVGKSGVSPQELNWISSMIHAIEDPIARVEVCAHVIVACAQFGNQWRSLSQTIMGQHLKPSTLAIQPSDWLKDKKLLRLVIMSDEECYLPQLLTIWIGASDRIPRDVSHSSLAFLLSQVFDTELASEVGNILAELKWGTGRSAFHKLDQLWRNHRATFLEAVNTRPEIRPLIRALVAADNYDWIRPLGNSLTRAFKGADGPALTTALEKANFRVATGKHDRKHRADGVAVAQAALDDGRLMELATTIFQRSGVPRPERGGEWEYPQNVSSLCRSLLRWQTTLNPGDRGGSWTDAPQLESRLKRAVDSLDWPQAEAICDEIVNRIHNSIDRIPEATARRLMNTLRRKRRFAQMIALAQEILRSGLQTAQVKRLYAQALIDLDRFNEAELVLNGMINDPSVTPGEINEARGLIGRVFKQKYVNSNDPHSESNRQNLVRALQEYEDVYKLDRRQYLWHGINVVALLNRAERDQVPVESSLRMQEVAKEILSTLEEREQTSALDLPAYDVATQLEAYVALGRESDAAGTALRYVDSLDADAFEIHSTKRQLTEVWQLNNTDTPGKHILPILQAAQLEKEGLFDEKPKNVLDEVVAVSSAVQDLGMIFGADRTSSLRWYQQGLQQCNSVARVERKNGQGIGTGFLVDAKDFVPGINGVLLVTADHIISNLPNQFSIPPEGAQVRFQALNEIFEIDRIVWSSPYTELDVAFLLLKGQPKAPPIRVHEKPVVMTTPSPRLYIIGHPQGRDLEISLLDNHLLACNDRVLHYRTPTEPGSSGSPVFESTAWEVVAIHHASNPSMKRLDGQGTYEANEGISILAVQKAIRESL